MHTICNPQGRVVRIVIFRKTGVQSMVEYPFTVVYNYNLCIGLCITQEVEITSYNVNVISLTTSQV